MSEDYNIPELDKELGFNEYQRLAQRTVNKSLSDRDRLIAATLGLCGEAGEVADLVKKYVAQGHELNRDRIIDEMSDVMWYLAELAEKLDTNLEYVAEFNIRKLRARYPEGFEAARSINRG